MRILFSIYYWSIAFVWMALLCVASFFVKHLFGYARAFRWVIAPGFKICLLLGFNRVRVTYHPHFNPDQPAVFCQNHVNLLDAFVAGSVIPHAFCGVMHAWQFNIPLYGWLMSITQGIAVHSGKQNNLDHLIFEARIRLAQNISVLVFPEGSRTPDGKVHAFRTGVFHMAKQVGYPMVPIAVKGLFAINQKGSCLFSPFRTIEVYVGEPVDISHMSDSEIKHLGLEMQKQMAQRVD